MGFDTGRVIFDDEDLSYYTGEDISGRLEFHQEKKETFQSIYALASGTCEVSWTTQHSRTVEGRRRSDGSRRDSTEYYHITHAASETYSEVRTYLKGGESGEFELNPGDYTFPFELTVPNNWPTSFRGSCGKIIYRFKVIADSTSEKYKAKEFTINVVAMIDLNENPHNCKEPMLFEFEDVLNCWGCFVCTIGQYEVTVKLPRSGFCPGEVIPIQLRCANDSKAEISQINFQIDEIIRYRTPDQTKTVRYKKATHSKTHIPSHTTEECVVEMVIPDMNVYNVTACKWIHIYYEFSVTVVPSGCHSTPHDTKRLIMGHEPLEA